MTKRLALLLTIAALLPACGSSGGGSSPAAISAAILAVLESEPNNTPAGASVLAPGTAGRGELFSSSDIDYWRFTATAGQILSIELHGARLDAINWDSNDSVPLLTLLEADGVTRLVRHDAVAWDDGWDSWHDLDIPRIQIQHTGTHFIRLYPGETDTGIPVSGGEYAVLIRSVSVGPVQLETEPIGASGVNDTWDVAEPIVPGTVYGWHRNGEVDFYSFQITEPTIVYFEMNSHRNGVYRNDDDYYDTEINLRDIDGTSVLLNNDDAFFYDSGIRYLLTVPGTYYIEVDACCNLGDKNYWLMFTTTAVGSATETEANDDSTTANPLPYGSIINASTAPGDVDFFSFSGTAGDIVYLSVSDIDGYLAPAGEVQMDFIDTDGVTPLASAGPDSPLQVMRTILQSTGTFYVSATYDGTTGPYALEIQVGRRSQFESEINDTVAQAGTLDANNRSAGVILTSGDVDCFKFTAVAKELVTISIFATSGNYSGGFDNFDDYGSQLEPRIEILDAVGGVLGDASYSPPNDNVNNESITGGLATFEVTFVAPIAGTYIVRITDEDGNFGADYFYVVERR